MSDIKNLEKPSGPVHFSAEDEVFYGKILGINDLVSFEGSSVKELKKAFREAVEDYLDTCHQVGKEPNKTCKGTFNVRIPTELQKQAAVYAATQNVSLNDFVRTAIDFALLHKSDVKKQLTR